jgi:hypothetical protein
VAYLRPSRPLAHLRFPDVAIRDSSQAEGAMTS